MAFPEYVSVMVQTKPDLLVRPDLDASFSGGDGGRKLEDGHPRGSDLFADARLARDAGCQYKMGHVC